MALVLVVVAGPAGVGAPLAIDGSGTLGRGSAARWQLDDPTVSREHCHLEMTDGRLLVRHGGGGSPTLVNGSPIEAHVLVPGDVLTLGETTLQVQPADGGLLVAPPGSTRVTLQAPRRARAYLGALAELADHARGASGERAIAVRTCEIVREALGAARAALYHAEGPRFLAELGAAGAGDAPRIAADLRERVIAEDTAMIAGDARDEHVLAPTGGGGLLVISAPALGGDAEARRAALELAATAARFAGALVAAARAREVAGRASEALRERRREPASIGASAAARQLEAQLRRLAASDATVLVLGESGAGKEVCATWLHHASRRAGGPFVAVNCAAIAPTLIESELFGHERGAFTGAGERRVGRFEQADGGTLFLDEIGELDARSQAKLLRVLEQRRFERLGSTRTLAVDVRVIAATNRDLAADVAAGGFRADLFHRLEVLVVEVPPLRARADDIPALAATFLADAAARSDRDPPRLADDAVALLRAHPWPGNVRELRNVIERLAVLVDDDVIDAAALRPHLRSPGPASAGAPAGGEAPHALEAIERQAIIDALAATGGNKTRAAERLGIDRTGLYKKLRRLGLRG